MGQVLATSPILRPRLMLKLLPPTRTLRMHPTYSSAIDLGLYLEPITSAIENVKILFQMLDSKSLNTFNNLQSTKIFLKSFTERSQKLYSKVSKALQQSKSGFNQYFPILRIYKYPETNFKHTKLM